MTTLIDYPITFIEQHTSSECWRAALSMLMDGREVGSGGALLTADGGLVMTPANMRVLADAYDLDLIFGQTLEHAALEEILAHGPIMVSGNMPTGHSFVIAGIRGPEVHMYDPSDERGPFWGSLASVLTAFPLATAYILQRRW